MNGLKPFFYLMEFEIKHKIWLERNGELLMGKGHAEILQALTSNPSLRQVAKQRKISYSKAWKLMKQLNQKATSPVVVMETGGKLGGQTTLTPFGKKLLAYYWQTHQQYAAFLEKEINSNKSKND